MSSVTPHQLQTGSPIFFFIFQTSFPTHTPRNAPHSVNHTTMTNELANILACERPVRTQLEQRLSTLSRPEQLSSLVSIFQIGVDASEHVDEVVAEAWSYLQEYQLWNVQYDTLTAFQKDIEFDDGIRHMLERHKKVLARMQTACTGIQKRWGGFLPDLLGAITPPRCTRHLLEMLHRLSKMCPFERAKELLEEAISARLKVPKASKTQWLTQGDVSKVISKLKILQPPKVTVTPRDGSPLAKRSKLSQHTDANERTAESTYMAIESSNERIECSSGSESELQEEGVDLQSTQADETMGAAMLGYLPAPEDEILTMSSQANTNSIRLASSCQCPALVEELDFHGRYCQPFAILHEAVQYGLSSLCDDHLRLLAHIAADLRNDIPASKLRYRLESVYRYKSYQARLHLRKPYWFLNQDNRADNENCPIYRYNALVPPPFSFNPERVFERFARAESHSSWLLNGSSAVANTHDYLKDFEILKMIETEFAMYRHHHQSLSSNSKSSALRNMYYSGIQQLLRQDPVAYALNAAASPNGSWRLITYPDIILEGANVSSAPNASLAMQDLGVHFPQSDTSNFDITQSNVIIERTTMGDPSDDVVHTTPIANVNLELSRANKFDEPMSRQHHISQIVQSWYCAIDKDHNLLGNGCALSWDELAACHRDLEAPIRGPYGQQPLFGRPAYRFPASVILDSTSALGEALIGRRKWNDPQVLQERDIVLGDDDGRAHTFVNQVRKRLVNRYLELFPVIESVERSAFGEHSYFRSRDSVLGGVS
jgi:hypothetical protein